MENTAPNYLGRYKQLSEKIDELLALPLPVPAEKHLLREQILELELRRLEALKHFADEQLMQLAVDFTLAMVPQNLYTYPMHLREKCMPSVVGPLANYARSSGQAPDGSQLLKLELTEKLALWRSADRDTSQ